MGRKDHTHRGATAPGARRRGGSAVLAAIVALAAAALVAPPARAGASTARPARPASANGAGLGLTVPTGDHHAFRHGAVPRIVSPSGPVRHFAVPEVSPSSARTGSKLLRYGGGLTTGGLVGAGVTTGPPRVYLVFLGSQWGTEATGPGGQVSFGKDPAGEAGALQTLYGGLGTDGELWSGTLTQYCDGVAVGATTCGSAVQAVPYPTGDVLAGVWYDNSVPATTEAGAGATGHQLAEEAVAAADHFGNTSQASNRDTQYVIASPTGSNADGWNNPQTGYCAYHDDTHDPTIDNGGAVVGGPIVAFTNLPYVPDAGPSCGAGSVNSPGVLDGATEAASHEYAETVTDQFPEANPPGGWADTGGSEIGDLCAYIAAPAAGAAYDLTLATGTVAVQGLWSNLANGGSGGCVQTSPVDRFVPAIVSIAPASAAVGSSVTITGTNLVGVTRVAFGPVTATVLSDGPGAVVAEVPGGVSSGAVSVTTPSGTATSAQVFTVAAPTVRTFTAAAVGQEVTITGTNLSGATRVAFNGVPAVVVSDGLTAVVAVVPVAVTPGPVTVQTPGGTAASARSFAPVPTLSSIAPASGLQGSLVNVTGTGLAGVKKVSFNRKKATVVSDSPTAIVVVVPKKAATGPLTVVTAGGAVTSASSFTVG